jgi:hypothetical protein
VWGSVVRVREDVKEDMLISVRVLMLSEMSRELRSLFYFCDDVVGPWRKHICIIELSGAIVIWHNREEQVTRACGELVMEP